MTSPNTFNLYLCSTKKMWTSISNTLRKIASNLEWPIEAWPILLQTVLKGKAQETYASLSVTDSANYNTVKTAILRNYEMILDPYKQRFRDCRMGENQTYVEFFRQKETYLDQWIAAKGIQNGL